MNRNKILTVAVLASTLLAACSTDEQLPQLPDTGKEVCLSATLQEREVMSRAGLVEVNPTFTNPYYLYYVSSTSTPSGATVSKKFEAAFGNASGVYWDDVQPATDAKANTAFQLTNVEDGKVYPATDKDIQWGEKKGWQTPLDFELKHKMAQLTLTIVDNTNGGAGSVGLSNPIYKEVKAVITSLSKDAEAFDIKTGVVTSTPREKEVVLYTLPTPAPSGTTYTSTAYFPPQTFNKKGIADGEAGAVRDSLRITCGKYTYTVAIPQKMTAPDGVGTKEEPAALREGEHLTLTITLTEETVGLTATLADWEEIQAEDMPLNRVFNIGSLEELEDFALAVNTGYDFKGMVVRLKKDISFTVSNTLHCFNIGTKSHPFRGLFDGGNVELAGLGASGQGNTYSGSLFGYTEGATLRNICFEAPYVNGQAVLVAEAKNTVIMGCTTNDGAVTGGKSDAGALVGKATGTTTLTNCYVTGTAVTGGNNVGGLVGSIEGSITHSSATGAVTGKNNVGGLVGKTSGFILHTYAWGAVKGDANVGGLVGTTNATVNNSYAAGTVTGVDVNKGGLLGSIGFGGVVKNCAWNKVAFGGTEDKNGAGLVDLTSTTADNNGNFDFSGTGSILTKLNTGTASSPVWKEEGVTKKPTFY